MIYQLAKTSPLITGQVKMNMIMDGNKVVDIQYVPLSNYIPFAYNNPIDVLNYTHGENVKSLYKKISGQFFKDVQNPKLSVNQLHRYDTLRDETRDFTYEMGMKRMEYQRYNKQFEFFCPFWCDDTIDFDKLKFIINIKNVLPKTPEKEKVVFSKVIEFDDRVKKYLRNIYPSLKLYGNNTDLLYINFNEMQSHIKGLNVSNGNVQTVDTSYIVNNLLMRERPVLETDNMLVNLFGSNKIISTQFFNFSFVFNIEDLLPINFMKSFISERINIYVDMYLEDKIITTYINDFGEEIFEEKIEIKKIDVKDLYTNYEFIPKYDIYTSKYSTEKDDKNNVLSYLSDNKCIELINKNKLVQSTFHWTPRNNQISIFNLYNGFSPLYKGEEKCTSISNNATDMFTDIFDENKNPYGVFKYLNCNLGGTNTLDLIDLLKKDSTYYIFDFSNDTIKKKEYQYFGDILINNTKVLEYKKQIENEVFGANIKKANNIIYWKSIENKMNDEGTSPNDYTFGYYNVNTSTAESSNLISDNKIYTPENTNGTDIDKKVYYANSINKIKCAVIKLNETFDYKKLRDTLDNTYLLTSIDCCEDETEKEVKFTNSSKSFLATQFNGDNGELTIIFFITTDDDNIIKKNISFANLYNIDFVNSLIDKKIKAGKNKRAVFYNYTYDKNHAIGADFKKNNFVKYYLTQKRICYQTLNIIANILKCAKFPNYITFDKSFTSKHVNSPSINSKETQMVKTDKYTEIYRYDANIIPMFIDLNDPVLRNNVYYCKQYNKDITNTLNSIEINNIPDIDGIKQYTKYALERFLPLYNSIGYYVLNSKEFAYEKYYNDVMFNHHSGEKDFYKDSCICYCKEITWFKNNSMLYLPIEFSFSLTKKVDEPITEDDIVRIIFNKIINESEGIYSEVIDKNNKKEYGYNLVKYYIKDLYICSYTYDYVDEKIEQQKYEIKFTLK